MDLRIYLSLLAWSSQSVFCLICSQMGHIISTMFGGRLCGSNLLVSIETDLLISAYSHILYVFSRQEATLLNKVIVGMQRIIDFHHDPTSNLITLIEADAYLVRFSLVDNQPHQIVRTKLHRSPIQYARILSPNTPITVLLLGENGDLFLHQSGDTKLLAKKCDRVAFVNQTHCVFGVKNHKDGDGSWLIDLRGGEPMKISHNQRILSAQIYNNSLIVGDEKGKITILKSLILRGIVSKQVLEWHTHPVTSLRIAGDYLYSAGGEGVVVIWHLREHRKDFLPRVGGKIKELIIKESQIYCLMEDNFVRMIDLGEDKAIRSYSVLVKPSTEISCAVQIPLSQKIILKSSPGKLQQINFKNGKNTQIALIRRNHVCGIDNAVPHPHQIGGFAFSQDQSTLVVYFTGINMRSLLFFTSNCDSYDLVSKIENCHYGLAHVTIVALNKGFLSSCASDTNVKIWKMGKKSKSSLAATEQIFWNCEAAVNYRDRCPIYVHVLGPTLLLTFPDQFVRLNLISKEIEAIYHPEETHLRAVIGIQKHHLILREDNVESIEIFQGKVRGGKKLLIDPSLRSAKIVTGTHNIAIWTSQPLQARVYVFDGQALLKSMSISQEQSSVGSVLWYESKLLAIDSNLLIYDLTDSQDLICNFTKQAARSESETMAEEGRPGDSWEIVETREVQSLGRKSRSRWESSYESVGVASSLRGAFQLVAHNMLL